MQFVTRMPLLWCKSGHREVLISFLGRPTVEGTWGFGDQFPLIGQSFQCMAWGRWVERGPSFLGFCSRRCNVSNLLGISPWCCWFILLALFSCALLPGWLYCDARVSTGRCWYHFVAMVLAECHNILLCSGTGVFSWSDNNWDWAERWKAMAAVWDQVNPEMFAQVSN